MVGELLKLPWGAWVEPSRICCMEVVMYHGRYHVEITIQVGSRPQALCSRPHQKKVDAEACLEAIIQTLQRPVRDPYSSSQPRSPYR